MVKTMGNDIFVVGTLTIDGKGYEFYFNNDDLFCHKWQNSMCSTYNIQR